MTPDEYCQERAAASGSSFYYSFLFLPLERRRAITALYAFCREIDDVVDECADPAVAAAKLAWWRREVAALYAGTPQHPVTPALLPLVVPYGITQLRLNEVLDSMEMDLQQARYPDFKTLERYCYHVAGAVGLLAAGIFGYANPQTLQYAEALVIGSPLAIIAREVGEDKRKARVYCPVDELQRFGVPAGHILAGRHTAAFTRLMAVQIDRAEAQYERALALLPAE